MRTSSLARLVVVGATIVSLGGCRAAADPALAGGAASPTASAVPGVLPIAPGPSRSPAGSGQASPGGPGGAATPGSAPLAWLLLGRAGEPELHLTDASSGQIAYDVPLGAPRPAWDRVVTASAAGDATIVRDVVVQPGLGGPELRLDGRWQLPTVGLDALPTGRSLDGSTIVLVEGAYDAAGGSAGASDPGAAGSSSSGVTSRFAIVEHHLGEAVSTVGDAPLRLARIVSLPGRFDYDALSPDGRILYLVQHLDADAGGHYQVRAVDVASGLMRPDVIVDKGNPDERMAGAPIAQVRRADGQVLTLYRGPEHPFIHLLNSTGAWAVCIDLPGASGTDVASGLDWGLAPSADGRTVFAVDAGLGQVVEIDPSGLTIRRSASIGTAAASGPTTAARIVLAKFGHEPVGPVGRRLVASPDGRWLFAGGDDGIAVIRTADLVAVRRDLAGSAIDALGILPDGTTLFALVRGSGRIDAVDAATGEHLGTVPGTGFDRLLAVARW